MSTKTPGGVVIQVRIGEGSSPLPAVLEYREVPYRAPAKPFPRAPPLRPMFYTKGHERSPRKQEKRADMATLVKLYKDHRTAFICGPSVHLTIYLCDEHAEELGDEVTLIETPRAGEDLVCAHCEFNRDTEMEEAFWPEPY
jgi:hypothetical protein